MDFYTYVYRPTITLNWGDGTIDTLSTIEVPTKCTTSSIITAKYTGGHTYSDFGDYVISYRDSFMVANISNINNSNNEKIYLENNLVINPSLGYNNPLVFLFCQDVLSGCNWIHNPCPYDFDHDSLSYELVPCFTSNYFFPPAFIDSYTGNLIMSPDSLGKYAIAIKVSEWRYIQNQYYYIGSSIRQMLLDVNSLYSINDTIISLCQITINPNPFNNSTILHAILPLHNASIIIYDMLCRKVKHMQNLNGNDIEITRESMTSGMYFFFLRDSNGLIWQGKLIVE
jgi:hypothetical protein